MKTIKITACLVVLLLAACDSGFDELNTSKTGILTINPAYVLNNALIRSSFPQQELAYELPIVQQIVTPNGGVTGGGNFNQDNRSVTQMLWQRYYREVLKSVTDVLDKTKDDATRSNLYNMARIWRAYAVMVLTDSYGDVPYAEAGIGFISGKVTPKYDKQDSIYTSILTELTEAGAALDPAKTIETNDILYSGDIAKWKRLAYSLLLRGGMRLSKVDEAAAADYVVAAVAGGVFQSNDDNAVIRHSSNYTNEVGGWLTGTEAANFYLARPFLNFLKANSDPRLRAMAVRYKGAGSGADQANAANGTTSPAVVTYTVADQIGMPMGYDNSSINTVVQAEGLKSFYDFSQLDRKRMGKNTAPMYLVTLSQTKLLLAEATVRGWISNQGTAAQLYSDGIRAHMQQFASYDAASAIATVDIDTYIDNHPLTETTDETALEDINTQYWISSFLNGPEAFANFRRSGYPVLTPNPYPGKSISGDFISRLTYPDSEISSNTVHVKDAISRQGGGATDTPDMHVWWDEQQ